MLVSLRGPVGELSRVNQKGNIPEDVKPIKQLLKTIAIDATLTNDSSVDLQFITAIKRFQRLFMPNADGRIDPIGGTFSRLKQIANAKAIIVDLKRQVLDAFSNLSRVYHFDCASGDTANPTPPGYYAVQSGRKHEKYRSKTYDAQMDYAMFFHAGYAIHMAYGVTATSLLKWAGMNSLGSHGCVRLTESDARQLFQWTPEHTPVIILPAQWPA